MDVVSASAEGARSRKFPRLHVSLPVTITCSGGAWSGHTETLSLRGCSVRVASAPVCPESRDGVRVTITFPSGASATLSARVVASNLGSDGWTIALEFRKVDPGLLAFIQLHVAAKVRRGAGY